MAEYIEREALIHAVKRLKVNELLRSDKTANLISGRYSSDWLAGFDCGIQQAINIIAAAGGAKMDGGNDDGKATRIRFDR